MRVSDLVDLLRSDMTRELSHMQFYLNAAIVVKGIHRAEYRELFLKEAASEMTHVQEFGDVIVGLGGIPPIEAAEFKNNLTCPMLILKEAINMENLVVANYVERMDQCEEIEKNGGLDKVDARWVHLFLENQLIDSRKTVDEFTQILNN